MQVHSFNQSVGELRGALEKEYRNLQVSHVADPAAAMICLLAARVQWQTLRCFCMASCL